MKPACTERISERVTQEIPRDYCVECPGPVSIGEWEVRQCINDKTIYQRSIIASYFRPDVSECEEAQWLMFEIRDNAECSDPNVIVIPTTPIPGINNPPTSPDAVIISKALVLQSSLVILIIVSLFIGIYMWRKKR